MKLLSLSKEEAVERSRGGGSWEFVEGDGGEGGYGEGARDLSSNEGKFQGYDHGTIVRQERMLI